MRLYHAVYFSRVTPQTKAEMPKILEVSRRNNPALDITGALFLTDDYVLQILEGGRSALTALLFTIMQDPRHTDLVVALFEDIDQRMFGDWAMACVTADTPKTQHIYRNALGDHNEINLLSGRTLWDLIVSLSQAESAGEMCHQMAG